MTRKKITQKIEENQEELTVPQVFDMLNFAKNLISGFPGIMTPQLINSQMQNISFNPQVPTEEKINNALINPKNSEEELRAFVEYLEIASAPFNRILSYMSSMLSLDLTYTNIDNDVDYNSKAYKDGVKKVWDFTDRFDYKREFRSVIKQLLRNEICVCCPRDDGDKIVLQELPVGRVKITGKWDAGYLIAFDFMYFIQPGVSLEMFPVWFQNKYNELFNDNSEMYKPYNPAVPVEMRGNTNFVYWVDVPPKIAFAFKFDESLTTAIPHYASLIPDLINQPIIRNLQKNIYMAEARKLLIGAVPLLKDSKAKLSDMISVSPEILGKFLSILKQAVGEAIGVAAAPLDSMSSVSFSGNNDLYNSYLKTAISASGVNSPLIYSGDLKSNAIESQLSFQSDSLLMEQNLYPQFAAFINYHLSMLIKKTRFEVSFSGNAYYLDRQRVLDNAMAQASMGIVLPQQIAIGLGMKPQQLIRQMKEAKASGFMDLLTPIINSAQLSGKDAQNSSGGRPSKADDELGDGGEQTRSSGSNIAKGGKK